MYIGIRPGQLLWVCHCVKPAKPLNLLIHDLSHAVSGIVKGVIRCAPLGIMGLVASTFAETGFSALLSYAQLLVVLIGCMLFVAFKGKLADCLLENQA